MNTVRQQPTSDFPQGSTGQRGALFRIPSREDSSVPLSEIPRLDPDGREQVLQELAAALCAVA
jgi:hypothetical protein